MIHLDYRDTRPIYTQIVEGFRQQILSQVLLPGEKLPSVRELAAEAGVNPNTMQRALAHLEEQGLVITNRTAGRQVTQDGERVAAIRMELAQKQIEAYLQGMEFLGFSDGEARALLIRKE